MEIISNDELVMVSGGRPDEVVAAIAAGAPLDDAGLAAWMAGAAVGGVVAVAHGQRGGLCPMFGYGVLMLSAMGAISYAYNDPYGALELVRPTFILNEDGSVCCLS